MVRTKDMEAMNGASTDRLVSDLRTIARDTEELLKARAGATGDEAREIRAGLKDALKRAKEFFAPAPEPRRRRKNNG